MEQGNRMNNHGGGKPPKMPRFNMSWLYVIILISLIVVFLNGGGDALGGSASKKATYTEFKEYIEKGYVLSVTANKNDGNLKVYVAPNHIRDVYHTSAKNVGPAPYVEVQYGSIDEVDKYLDNMVKAKKIKSYNYVNEKGNDFISLLINFAPLIIFFLLIWWVSGRMGAVKDATGEPIIGATIRIEGKTGGTVTDLDGNFTLSNIEKGTKLTITYVGYKSQTLTWSGSPLNITLQDDANMLEETVVIGYGTVKKADLAGSVAVLDSKNFKDQPVARVEDALNGRMSGVQVMSSGVPGGAMKIRVRGTSSVNKSNDPLYVVDGIVRETGLEGISPEDIQSIQVLKDASSTAIYGARGANGVVMVQTKSGKAGATQVTFDASVGFSNAYHIPEVMGTKEYAQALIDYKGVSQGAMQDYLDGTKPGIDWMDELLRTGITQNYKVAVSQGNEKTQTYFSANYMDQKGVITDTKSRRYAIKANMHNKIFDWLEMTTDINLAQTDNSGAGFAQNQSNPIWVGLNYSPTMEMMAPNGNYIVLPSAKAFIVV